MEKWWFEDGETRGRGCGRIGNTEMIHMMEDMNG